MARRGFIGVAVIASLIVPVTLVAADRLTDDEKIELLRGLSAEFATVKVPLARTKKPLEFYPEGTFDPGYWEKTFKAYGPAARAGEIIQITKVTFETDRMLLDINGGITSGRPWYTRIQGGVGTTATTQTQVDNGSYGAQPTLGTYIVVIFRKPMEGLTSDAVKKMLAPIMEFDQRSAAQLYSTTLSPEMQNAVTEKRAIVGMTKEEVKMAMGQPETKYRETNKEGVETEDWIYGKPPGKVSFVTFAGSKVIKVKDEYAGLGGDVTPH